MKQFIRYQILAVLILVGLNCGGRSDETQVKEIAGRHADGILSWAMSDILHEPEKVEWDALGRYLQTMSFRLEDGSEKYRVPAQHLVQYLVKNARMGHSDRVGWGLRSAWDSNSDGTINAENTIYTYTSCWVGFGLLDASRVGVKGEYNSILKDLVLTFQVHIPSWISEDGRMMAIRYSDNPNDWKYLVQNVTAYAYLFFIRMAVEKERSDLLEDAQKYFTYQRAMQRQDGNWSYYDPKAMPPQETDHGDDLNHWAMEGVAMYRAYQLISNEGVRDVGRRCVEALRKKHFGRQAGQVFDDNSSIDWGVAEALKLFSLVKMVDRDEWIADLLPKLENKYINEDGRWYKHTDNHQTQSWYACALAHIAKCPLHAK
jgi:hypothetical protein